MRNGKKWWRWLLLVSLLSSLVWGRPAPGLAQPEPPDGENHQSPLNEFAPGEILVGLKRDLVQPSGLLSTWGVEVIDALDECTDTTAVSTAGVLRLRVAEGREWEAIAELQNDPAVAFAEPNWIVYAADASVGQALAQPETPFLVNDPSYVDRQWYLQRIKASRAWGLAYDPDGFRGQMSTVQVAVIDSGIDLDHPEFAGILLPGKNYVTVGAPPVDRYGHGTHVAGLIGAIINNGTGIAGVAPKVKIDPRKVLSDSGSGTIDNVARGICEAADAGANIINLSLESASAGTMREAVAYASAKGALLIGAAGNRGLQTVAYPAAFPEVMAVAAVTYDDLRASYSNYHPTLRIIEIAAPGGVTQQSIYSTWAKGAWCRDVRATLQESGYCTAEGTSMAAAIVTGAAALVWSLNCCQTASDVRSLLRQTAAPIGGSVNEVGDGRLDLHALVRRTLRSELRLSHTNLYFQADTAGSPYTATIRLTNPSGEAIQWEAALLDKPGWLHLAAADDGGIVSGESRYGQPGHLSFVMTPLTLTAGIYNARAQVIGTRSDTTQVIQQVAVDLLVGTLTPQSYLPFVLQRGGGTIPPPATVWEQPVKPQDRMVISPSNDNTVRQTLPFTFTLQSVPYHEVHVNANGFVSFGLEAPAMSTVNRCLPNRDEIGAAIYGWWADLNPAAAGARISTFQPAADRFVIEYADVPNRPLAGAPPYVVNFQIVLFRNGNIGLNYGLMSRLPTEPPVTVGVEARDGLFFNQIACRTATAEFGYLPISHQSLLLKAEGSLH
jgi:thermitase